MLKRIYVWEFPVRLTHWLNFLSITALSITGFYIGAPFIHAVRENAFVMAQMRFIHFVSSYVFAVSFLIRIYWLFVGNQHSTWSQFIPLKSERLKNLYGTTAYYCFLREKCPRTPGHTGIAGVTYLLLFVIFLFEILTGFALYAESHTGGLWTFMGGWLSAVLSAGAIRLIHHGLMWLVIPFVILHVYVAWHNDNAEKNGLISSMFSGYKTMEE